jgi:hypothetical protein
MTRVKCGVPLAPVCVSYVMQAPPFTRPCQMLGMRVLKMLDSFLASSEHQPSLASIGCHPLVTDREAQL